ncbi:MAG: DUF2071 domain-containing protein [Bacteroidetes bacterium]|nr:DUF2071 domain-containing protein [Bacteroidota bacterium]
MKPSLFLTAEWRHLVFANYIVVPAVLNAFVPPGTELDFYSGKCFVSLVGFMFNRVRVKGLRIPMHTGFPEVNLRFYVRYSENGQWHRGVVFIKEIVPKPLISAVANIFFKEHYITLPVTHNRKQENGKQQATYSWGKEAEHAIEVIADEKGVELRENSEEEFITQHFRGYTFDKEKTSEYHVAHPAWNICPVNSYNIRCAFEELYGKEFDFLSTKSCDSVFLADGSAVSVYTKRVI